jgi:hypothetical protein
VKVRIWSKKVISVLRYFYRNQHAVLFGITGDIDNLGVYVARNGRAKAEVLVDSYNRIVGSVYYRFISSRPHEFSESLFLPAGEEVFILGISATGMDAQSLFDHIEHADIPGLLTENTSLSVETTNISFGCGLLNDHIDMSLLEQLLESVEQGNVLISNDLYARLVERVRAVLARQLDLKKFGNISKEEKSVILLRNLVYAKTLEYKGETKKLLIEIANDFDSNPSVQKKLVQILGTDYGLGDKSYEQLLIDLRQLQN